MERHKRGQEAPQRRDEGEETESSDDGDGRFENRRRTFAGNSHHRSMSDSDSDDVEELPKRFDRQGESLDGQRANQKRWSSRSGQFERQPTHPGDWNVQGAWHIGGTNEAAVEKLTKDFTDALDGRKSWMNVVGEVLSGSLNAPAERSENSNRIGDGQADRPGDDNDSRKKRRQRRED